MTLILDPIVGTVCFIWPCRLLPTIRIPAPAFHASNCKFANLDSDTTLDSSLTEPLTSGQVDDVAGTRLAASPYAANLRPSLGAIILGSRKSKTGPRRQNEKDTSFQTELRSEPTYHEATTCASRTLSKWHHP
ncbi:hypothetical protein CGRA01v4_11510 [Colletotrichum graminicola]|nr:hypothetical protein CGRA01v4_11510 [Colletotrichum graminicola]